jgi:hypothetical protein
MYIPPCNSVDAQKHPNTLCVITSTVRANLVNSTTFTESKFCGYSDIANDENWTLAVFGWGPDNKLGRFLLGTLACEAGKLVFYKAPEN